MTKVRRVLSVKAAFIAFALIASTTAQAAYFCTATLNSVLVYADGTVNVNHSGRNEYTIVCNLNTAYKGIPTSVCAAWAATLLQSKRANASLQFYYDGTGTCATLPTYGDAPVPLYIGML